MKHNLLFSAFLFVALFFTPNVWGAQNITVSGDVVLNSATPNTSSHPKLRFETNAVGDVIITILDGEGATNAHFRKAAPFNSGIQNKFRLRNSDNSDAGAADKEGGWFWIDYEYGNNQFILRRNSTAFPSGYENPRIVFNDDYIRWSCTEGDFTSSTSDKYTITYVIGACYGTLATPSPAVSPEGVVSFSAVTDATSYTARVYLDRKLVHEQSITNGGSLTFKPFINASTTYKVTVQAHGANNTYSAESALVDWTKAGNVANISMLMSDYCDRIFTHRDDDKDEASKVYVTAETRKGVGDAKDTLIFTIKSVDGTTVARWRSKGLQVEDNYGLRYDGKKFYDYFEIPSTPTPTESGQPRFNDSKEIRYVPKTGASVEYGKRITFNTLTNARSAEWKMNDTDRSTNIWTIDYIYGTNCIIPSEPEPEHSKPVISGINESKVITFTGIPVNEEEIDSYRVQVKLGGVLKKSQDDVVSGTTAVSYAASVAGTYQVYVQAIKDGNVYSTSEAFDWALPKEMSAPSEYCGYDVTCNSHTIKLTSETNFVGDVIIRIADGENSTNAVFRGNNGMGSLSSYKVTSNAGATTEDASTYFSREYNGEGSREYILRRKVNATLPADAKITFNGSVEWMSDGDGTNNLYQSISYNYTYGSSCATLPMPVISEIDGTDHISFTGVAGATHYTLRVYNGKQLMHTQNISTGDQITYLPYIEASTDYTITVQAFDNEGGYSDESAGVTWNKTGDLSNLPASNVCDYLIHQDGAAASYAYLSIETDDSDGSVYITIAPDNAAFRSNFINNDGLKYDGTAITTYFERTTEDVYSGSYYKTLKYTPKNRDNVQYGKNITFNTYGENAQIEWRIGSTDKNTPNMSFSYIYGTACSIGSLTAHGNTSELKLHANHPNDNLTVNEAMTINGNGHTIGDITVTTAGALTVGSALTANKLLVETKPGASGQVIGADKLTVSEAWTSQQLLPDEADLKPATDWYCFTVPFEVSLTNGVYTNEGVKMTSGSDYLVWRYDGAQRASTGNGWVKASDNLQPGQAYLIGFKDNETAKTFRFKSAGGALSQPASIALNSYPAAAESNANWNAVGNPSLRHIDVSGIGTVQMLNNATQTFSPYATNSYSFGVGAAFFAQQGAGSLTLDAASHALLAPARTQAQRMQACVEVYKEGRTWPDDRIYVAADEDASDTWQQGHDVPTLNTTSNRVLLMHIAQYGMRLAAVERPWAEQVDYNMVLTAPADGTYTLHMASVTSGASVWLTQNGVPVWDMTAGDYILDMRRGTDTSYGLRLIQTVNPVATGLGNAPDNMLTGTKVLRDGRLVIIKNGTLYNALGQIIQ